MQLDNTRIVIRERTYLDVLDLTLRVIRAHGGRLGLALAAGIAPCFALNCYLLADVAGRELEVEAMTAYGFSLAFLIAWEIPLATAPATLYLGGALFDEPPRARQIASRLLGSLPQLVLYQVVLRGLLLLPWITWVWLFTRWAYLNEVILLERNPLRRKRRGGPSTGRRCRALHAARAGDLFGRWLGSLLLGVLLVGSFGQTILMGHGVLVGQWETSVPVLAFCAQLAAWLVVAFFCVARFLGYLDLRIRREGWEVELLLRAEAARLTETVAAG